VGFGIAYSWREGNAKAYKSGMSNSFDSRAFSLCSNKQDKTISALGSRPDKKKQMDLP